MLEIAQLLINEIFIYIALAIKTKYSEVIYLGGVLKVGDREFELDEDGFLVDWEKWDEEVAKAFAAQDGIELTDEHWEIIHFLRKYYLEYKIAPPIRMLVKEVKKALGPEKGNLKYIYKLFPGGPAKMACKYAGLPKPTGCV